MGTINEKLVLQYQAEVSAALKRIASLEKGQGKLENRVKKFSGVGKKFNQGLQTTRSAMLPVIAAVGAAAFAISKLIGAYGKQEEAEAKLRGALIATQGAIGLSQKELIGLASELQRTTKFGDETIISAEAMLLTFVKIGKDVFPEAIERAADMSTIFGTDLKSSTVQLGKALNDPIAGLGSLSRIGVQFTDEQKKSIKQFVEQNDIMSAQRIILDELKNEFGGVAREVAKTGTGPLTQFGNKMGDLAEVMGGALIPIINDAIRALDPFVDTLINLIGGQSDLEKSTETLISLTDQYKIATDRLNSSQETLSTTQRTMLEIDRDLARASAQNIIVELAKGYEKANKKAKEYNSIIQTVRDLQKKANEEIARGGTILTEEFFKPELFGSIENLAAWLKKYRKDTELGLKATKAFYTTLASADAEYSTKIANLNKERENAILSIINALNVEAITLQDLAPLGQELINIIKKRREEQKTLSEEGEKQTKKVVALTEDQIKLQEEFRRAQLTDTQKRLEDIANEKTAYIQAGVSKIEAERYYIKQRAEILSEERQKLLEEEQKKRDRLIELSEASDAAFKEASDRRTEIIIAEAQAQEDALIAAQEKYREEFLRTKDMITEGVHAVVMEFVSTMQQTGDVWKAFQQAGKEAVAQVISAFGDQYNILGAAALVPGPTFNPAAAAGYFTVGASAKLLSSVLRSFEYGGRFTATGPTPIIVGDNTARTETVQITPTGGTSEGNNGKDKIIYNEIYINKEKLFSVITKGMKRREILVDSGAISQ